ncbi:P-loop containing nucleoside triphosphate hydrolase protein [Lasiosphaeria hispida]|uniref:ATP-dependent RNA helicase n=1 Tax=Lasiosphaeria hispida TaxID=260671 RepID=A0AAJ0HJT0_9PEZI|nr:P-loop containing nucleoside triphosphate hydrolase protein [Lasiosphaeria hispida]
MADDGMLLNFELGDAPIKSQVKFKGGAWRDRVKAQKSVKKWQQTDDDSSRPTKRPRTDEDATDRQFKTQKTAAPTEIRPPSYAMKMGQISSSVFTSNPTAVTSFDEPEEEPEPAQPSNAPLTDEAENFLALGLSRRVSQHLATKLGMKAPTAIQKNTIPQLVKEDTDAFLQAETGSGKTLAYLLPIVHRILMLSMNEDGTSKDTQVHRNSGLFAIILAPTRELCKQISVVLEKVLRCAPWLVCTTVTGGENKKSEKSRIRKGVNILVATPGRLTDHLDNTKVLDVGTVRWLVFDEGDRMMEMGFEDDIRTIVSKIRQDKLLKQNKEGVVLDGILPARRVTILCSATMRMDVQKLGEISLEDAVHITASKADMEKDAESGTTDKALFSAPTQLKQSVIITPAKLRLVTLVALLKSAFARRGSMMKVIIFISCADSVDFHFELLKSTTLLEKPKPSADAPDAPVPKPNPHIATTVAQAAYVTSPASPIVMLHKLHGSLVQSVRTATLQAFTACKEPTVLITTDISSRGLDVPAVDLVIEYDPAFAVPDHVHRIGRTARAGRAGKAVLFLQPGSEEGYTSLLNSATPIAPQLYESILQKGFASAIDLPPPASSVETEKQTWMSRAENLQLHFEQRLLTAPGGQDYEDAPKENKWKTAKAAKNSRNAKPKDNPLLDAGRQAFRSHIRAYATHVRDERKFFDITQLHLGHMAKSFGLREAPGGIGGGSSRRTVRPSEAKTHSRDKSSNAASRPAPSRRDHDGDDELGVVDESAARRMKEKMMSVMNSTSEFNLG